MKSKKLFLYLYGMKQAIPVLIGFLPVSITYAIMATGAGMTLWETVGMSAAVFAGASQIMAVGMLSSGAGYWSIVISTLVLNLRHIIMSTCVFRKMRKTTPVFRSLLGFGVTDETFALFTTEDDKDDPWFMLGLITVAYSSWILGALIGVLAGNLLPASVSLSFGIALYALFLSLLTPNVIKDGRLLITVAVTVALNCLLRLVLDDSWSIICATLLGAAFGVWITECCSKEKKMASNAEQEGTL